jgi:hypothetical protein
MTIPEACFWPEGDPASAGSLRLGRLGFVVVSGQVGFLGVGAWPAVGRAYVHGVLRMRPTRFGLISAVTGLPGLLTPYGGLIAARGRAGIGICPGR